MASLGFAGVFVQPLDPAFKFGLELGAQITPSDSAMLKGSARSTGDGPILLIRGQERGQTAALAFRNSLGFRATKFRGKFRDYEGAPLPLLPSSLEAEPLPPWAVPLFFCAPLQQFVVTLR